ncbi:MAG TPA: hypothetical protein VF407_08430 [Polyangiaceae bacterium]
MRPVTALALACIFPLVAAACGLDDGTVTIVGGSGPNEPMDSGSKVYEGGEPVHPDGGPSEDGGTAIDGGGPIDSGPTPDQPIVWATTATDLYSLEVTTGKLAKKATLSGCATSIVDLAVDPAGQLLAILVNGGERDLADVATTGACSNLRTLDSKFTTALAFQGSGVAAKLFALRSSGRGLHLVERADGTDDEVQSNLFDHNFDGDFACSADACYTVGAKYCTTMPPAGSSCIGKITWSADGDYAYAELGAVAVPSVVGVAWHGGNVYLFSGAQPGVSVVNVASLAVAAVTLSGDPAPASWVGAGSTSAYP